MSEQERLEPLLHYDGSLWTDQELRERGERTAPPHVKRKTDAQDVGWAVFGLLANLGIFGIVIFMTVVIAIIAFVVYLLGADPSGVVSCDPASGAPC